MSELGQSETPNHVRDEGSFPPKRSPGAGDGCAADHRQPRLLLVAQLAPIADVADWHLQRANALNRLRDRLAKRVPPRRGW